MRILVDNALSPLVATGLRKVGHDAVHVRDYGLQAASDRTVLARAATEDRILITADSDFALLLAEQGLKSPSIVLFRGAVTRKPDRQIELLLTLLPNLEKDLASGSIVVIEQTRIRVRRLPLSRDV